eukprot:13726916-Alexandrium_andersonii.AAC.1
MVTHGPDGAPERTHVVPQQLPRRGGPAEPVLPAARCRVAPPACRGSPWPIHPGRQHAHADLASAWPGGRSVSPTAQRRHLDDGSPRSVMGASPHYEPAHRLPRGSAIERCVEPEGSLREPT